MHRPIIIIITFTITYIITNLLHCTLKELIHTCISHELKDNAT